MFPLPDQGIKCGYMRALYYCQADGSALFLGKDEII